MDYTDTMKMIDWLSERFRKAGLKPWYRWAVDITWDKIERWASLLGYKGGIDGRYSKTNCLRCIWH